MGKVKEVPMALALHSPRRKPSNQIFLKKDDDKDNWGRNGYRGCCGNGSVGSILTAGVGSNRNRQSPVGLQQQPPKQKFVVGQQQRKQAGRNHARPGYRHDYAQEYRQATSAVDHRCLFQGYGYFHKKAAQHPDCERLIDRNQNQNHQQVGIVEPQDLPHVVKRQTKRNAGQGSKAQSRNQDDHGQAPRISGKRIAAQAADRNRNQQSSCGNDDAVDKVAVEFGYIYKRRRQEHQYYKHCGNYEAHFGIGNNFFLPVDLEKDGTYKHNCHKADAKRQKIGNRASVGSAAHIEPEFGKIKRS